MLGEAVEVVEEDIEVERVVVVGERVEVGDWAGLEAREENGVG